jgi:transglutaminase/protease-like cytokinesis protein 3
MSLPHSVQSVREDELGLTTAELQLLRHQQQVMAQRSHQNSGADRGRGTSRHSQPSSRNVSAASSQGGQNRIIIEPRYLQALTVHLDNVMRAIQNRLDEASESLPQPPPSLLVD